MTKPTPRIGRPMQAPVKGKRTSLGLKVSPDIKRRIDQVARDSGKTQSQVAEALIERALAFELVLKASTVSEPDMKRRMAEAVFRAEGYVIGQRLSDGSKIWVPKKHMNPKLLSGFRAPEEEDK